MTYRLKGAIFGSQPFTDTIAELLGRDLAWVQRSALCAQVDDEERDRLFFPGSGSIDRRAFEICAECPLIDACRDYAVARKGVLGVWGGTSEAQREAIRAGKDPKGRAYAQCGTRAAYEAHRKRGEKACDSCREAERLWSRARRAAERAA